jgi:hypothetical protein
VLDLLTSASSLPASFVNNGVVITNSQRVITSAAKVGNDFVCTCIGYAGHTYQLQMSNTLNGGWTDVGGPIAGTNVPIEWSVTNGAVGAARFFRVLVEP